jgi:hypothetical protein
VNPWFGLGLLCGIAAVYVLDAAAYALDAAAYALGAARLRYWDRAAEDVERLADKRRDEVMTECEEGSDDE